MTDEIKTNMRLAKSAPEIGLEDIDDAAIVNLLRDRRRLLIECLEELLQQKASPAERHAAASALCTLTQLRKKLAPEAANDRHNDQDRSR